ncbi:unnamed protein product [Rotaria magnacalcarata]|uniref:TRPM SLOG domain-containing protein n=1 Tax=Rotaria magnacalcarata TaxID=392030 RepID=A0A820I5P0_9BILA|nr:unnamed protein product [Rotaria magnacalcarata]
MVFKLSSSHKLTNDRYPVVYRNNVRFARPPPSNSSRSPSAEKLIVEFMEKAWELPKPNLVISVTGRMERFKWPSLRARYDFQRGLIAAANATSKVLYYNGCPRINGPLSILPISPSIFVANT